MTRNAFSPTADDLLQNALRYAARGWPVLPLHTPHAHGCSCCSLDCTSSGKHPRTQHGAVTATTRTQVISAWWRRWPDANVGVATGGALAVLDVDGARGLRSVRGRTLPPTLTVATGSGFHYYFRTTRALPCRVGLLPSVDVRGVGGYVVAPPSLHRSGHRYTEAPGLGFADVGLASVPEWLDAALTTHRRRRLPDEWRSLLHSGVQEGARNDTLASIAGHLLRAGVDAGVAVELLSVWNGARCRPPLPVSEVEKVVASVARAEARRREAGAFRLGAFRVVRGDGD
ncbi:MAG TPA: bifunctional DNA primase/polymerase [Candidatus Angelobacter sp.]|jgi:hypothetical protein|nr:bifunctional DNA primase/polymerase [Candidatus Angelobacter sp.]